MRKSKYDFMVSVCWRDVLRCLRWGLNVRYHDVVRWIDYVREDIEHGYPEVLDVHLSYALEGCERVFYYFELINSVRSFLRYKPKTAIQLGIQRCYDFYAEYKKESPSSDSLSASTTGGRSDIE